MKVLRGYNFRGADGDLLRAFQVLYPGDIDDDILKMNAALVADKLKPTTVGEFFCLSWSHAACYFLTFERGNKACATSDFVTTWGQVRLVLCGSLWVQ